MTLSKLTFVTAVSLILAFSAIAQNNSVSIGTTSTDASAVLWLVGNNSQGLILPITNSIGAMPKKPGMVVYNSVDSKIYVCDGTNWTTVGGSGSGGSQTLSIAGNTISISGGNSIPLATAPTASQFYMFDGTNWVAKSLSQDILNTMGVITVNGIKGKPLPANFAAGVLTSDVNGVLSWSPSSGSLPTPGANQILTSDNTSAPKWASTILGSQVTPNFGATTVTGLTVSGTTTTINTKPYVWPNTAASANSYLKNDGTGNLSWATLTGGGNMSTTTYDTDNDGIVDKAAALTATLPLAGGGTGITTTPVANQLLATNGTGTVTWINQSSLTPTFPSQTANTFYAAPNGAAGVPTFRTIVAADIPALDASKITTGTLGLARGGTGVTTTPTNGQLLIGNGAGYTAATLTAGTNVSITNGAGSITINSSGLGSTLTSNNIFAGSNTNVATGTPVGGDLSMTVAGGLANFSVSKLGGQGYTFPASSTTVGVLTNAVGNGTLTWAPVSGFLTTGLPSGNIIVGNSAGVATQTAMSGDATISSTGALTLATTSGNNIVNAINSAATTASITDSKLATISTLGKVAGDAIQSGTIGGTTVISTSGDIVTTGGSLSIFGTTTFGGIKYTWPTTPLAAPTKYLSTDAAGNLNWATVPSPFSTLNTIPKGDGTTLVASQIYDNGTNVGIGTTAPTNSLHVVSANPDIANFVSSSASDNRIVISNASGPLGTMGYTPFNNTFQLSSYSALDLSFGSGNLATEIMRLKANGYVGIGTTSPASQLDVQAKIPSPANAINATNNDTGNAIYAYATSGGKGVWGYSPGGDGVEGQSGTKNGVFGYSDSGVGVYGSTSTGYSGVFMGGNVGIGTAAPTQKLDVAGSIRTTGYYYFSGVSASNSTYQQYIAGSAGNYIYITDHFIPNLGNQQDLGTSIYRWRTVYTNNTVNVSDFRLKKNIENLNYGLKEVLGLRPVSYIMKDDKEEEVKLGLIAQEAQKLVPEVVSLDNSSKEKYLGMNYTELIPVLIKAVQEQQKIIDEQKNEIKNLKDQQNQKASAQSELNQLKIEIANIKKALGMEASTKKK